jgi:hypothetical protein
VTEVRWIAFGVFAVVFLLAAIGNAAIVVRWLIKRKHVSLAPIVGGVSGALAAVVAPVSGVREWFWVPLVIDLGTAYLLVSTAVFLLSRRGRFRR